MKIVYHAQEVRKKENTFKIRSIFEYLRYKFVLNSVNCGRI